MTTAFAYAARGDMLSSFLTQPFGAILALATAITVVVGFYAALTGTRVAGFFAPLASRFFVLIGVGVLLAAWGFKTLQFKGLIG